MKYNHQEIAKQHIERKRLFIEENDYTGFVLVGDGFSSIELDIHGYRVVVEFSLEFESEGHPVGIIKCYFEPELKKRKHFVKYMFDQLGNIKNKDLSHYNISQKEGVIGVLINCADAVVQANLKEA